MVEEVKEFVELISNDIRTNITDIFFKTVEEKPQFKKIYDDLCDQHGKNTVNQKIGLLIKQMLDLENKGTGKASSELIQNYTKH